MSMVMGRRGRRPVLQLDDVSSSHQPRHQGIQPPQNGEKKREPATNPLLSLVGQYYSDSSSAEEDSDGADEEGQEEKGAEKEAAKVQEEDVKEMGKEAKVKKEAEEKEEDKKETEIPVPVETKMFRAPELPAPEPLQTIPLPEPPGELGSSIDSEVASFLAEIESISVEPSQDGKAGTSHAATADSSQPVEPDLGFIPRPDASVPIATEEKKDHKPASFAEEKRSKPSSSVNAYKSMFVKGASEFVHKEKEDEKRNNEMEIEEELPEEPVSEWQMVQDDATQYYYYWNLVTNEVTWEIPPGYTQFLLLYKEYEERIAKIPKDKLQRMKERKEKKKQGSDTKRESSPAPSSSEPKSKSSKHKKEKHRKETSETVSTHVEIGPQLPSLPSETTTNDAKATSGKSEDERDKTVNPPSSKILVAESLEGKTSVGSDSAVDSTSVLADVEAIFDAALSAVAGSSSDSSKPAVPVITSSSAETTAPGSTIDVTRSSASAESSKPSSSVESSKSASPTAMDMDSTTTTTTAASAAVVSSSSVILATPVLEKDSKDTENGEAVVTNSGVNDDAAADDDDDDFDMDFDDIDDLDRALEKALEKKLEKRKAELEKLEQKQADDGVADSIWPPSSPRPAPTQSETSTSATKTPAASVLSPSEPESAVSSSVRTGLDPSDAAPQPSKKSAVSSASSSISEVAEAAERSGVKPQAPKSKRSAAASSPREVGSEKQEPAVKKARLVAYDAPETDEESLDTSDEVSTTPVQSTKPCSESDSAVDALPQPASVLAEVREMTDTAFAKLAFLDVTSDSLSPLQISLIQLQTRLTDWQEGGLVGEYFYQRLREVDTMLKKYESSAVPPGWTCQWDSNFRRYFYINTHTGESQWDYPEGNAVDSSSNGGKRARKVKGSKKKKVKATCPELDVAPVTEATPAMSTDAATSQSGIEEDLDGVAMADDEAGNQERLNGESADLKPTTSSLAPESGDGVPSALQALFPGEPLPPGTELLLGLPPPPPPPLPLDEVPSTTDDAYVCAEDSSDESGPKDDDRLEQKLEAQAVDPEIDGEEMVEEEEKEEGEEEEVPQVVEDPAVISRPPQLRFPAVSSSASLLSASSLSVQATGFEPSSSSNSSLSVRSAAPVLNAAAQLQPDSASSIIAAPAVISASNSGPSSPKMEEWSKAGSPAPVNEATSSSTADHHKHEKHKKKKKEKLGSHTMSLKKKGVSSLVQKWQKVKKEVEQEERANEQRQMAIRQQLEEWKKENS